MCIVLFATLDIIQEATSLFSECMYSLDLATQGPFCAVYGIARFLHI